MVYLRCAREVAPLMIAFGWGRIINISGMAARMGGSIIGTVRNVSVAALTKVLADERGLKHTTVATLLTRLERRGVVAQRREGRQRMYRALVSESQVRRSMVGGLIGILFGGDSRELVAHLLRESEIEPGDLERLRKRLKKGQTP